MAKKESDAELALQHLKKFTITAATFESRGNIPTGHFSLDFAIHYGMDPSKVDLNELESYDSSVPLGFPLGKLVELFGEEGGGKSSLALRAVGYAQKLGYTTAWIDAEHSFQESLAVLNGCIVDDIIYPSQSLFAEDIIDLIISMCKTDKVPMTKNGKIVMVDAPKVIVIDSIASMIPKARDEAMSDQQFMALLARIMSSNLGKVAQEAEKYGVLIIFINQLREKIGVSFGNPEVSPGGRALKHHFSLRLKITRQKNQKANIYRTNDDTGEEILIGGHSYINIVKNRFAKPYFESLVIPIYYESYFPDIEELAFESGRQTKVISVRKGVFSWRDLKIEGRNKFIDHISEGKKVDELISDIKESASEKDIILPPEINLYEYENAEVDEQVATKVPSDGTRKHSKSGKNISKKDRVKSDS